tara:strand:+ start:532 stop:1065 length:534 start_codon:yes stop_codon:yes gene_type:complete
MKIEKTLINDCLLIQPKVHTDERGFFLETYQKQRYSDEVNISFDFVQDNHSASSYGVLRGLHFQKNKPQGKLVRCVNGNIFDVAVDIRPYSKTFKRWFGVNLSASNYLQLWVPPGLAHGFLVTSDYAEVEYKCTEFFDPEDEESLLWNDPDIGIEWPNNKPILSTKDLEGKLFSELF